MNGARLFRIRFPRQARGTTCIPSGLVYAAPDAVTTIRNDGAPISSASTFSLSLMRFSAPLSAHASVSLISAAPHLPSHRWMTASTSSPSSSR